MAEYGVKRINKPTPDVDDNKNSFFSSFTLLPESSPSNINPKSLKVSQKDLLVFFRQLAVVLQSGVPLAQGLELLSDNMTNKKFSFCVFDLAKRLNSGEDLSTALMAYPRVFPPITVGLIEAGEAGGILSKVLERIALLLEAQAKIRGEIKGALTYPMIVLVLAVTVSLALLIFIVPQFQEMFADLGAKLPALTLFMLTLSKIVVSTEFLIGAPVGCVGIVFLFNRFYSTKSGRLIVDRLILKIPLFGDLILRSEMASMSDTLSTLVNSGIPLVEGLDRCITACSNQVIKLALSKSIILIQQGQELSYAFGISKVIPKLLVSMVKIGEETGALPFMLENLANFYKREVEETVSNLTKAMEPAVIFVVAGIVGTIVVSLYLPMFDLLNQMGA